MKSIGFEVTPKELDIAQNTLFDDLNELDEDLKVDSPDQTANELYPIDALKVEKAFYSIFEFILIIA